MGKYLKLFNTHADYQAFTQTSDFIKPNVSHCVQENDVHYNPWVETRVVAKFNVTSTSSATKIMNSASMSYCNDIDIDGVVQPSVVYSYQFDTTGEHTVKYTLSDPTNFEKIFQNCSGLTSVIIPNNVTSIGSSAFQNCSSLTSVEIGGGVTSISSNAFYFCYDISNIVVDSNNTKYDSRDNCNAIIETSTNKLVIGCKSTVIPNSVTSIGYGAFHDCSGLTTVTIPNSVTSIGGYAFSGCKSLTSIDIPNNVTSIDYNVFWNCTGLTSVTIGSGVTSIGSMAFKYCSSLTSVTIPDSVTSIGNGAFESCSSLTSVTIGSGVTTIGEGVLSDCSSLTSVTIEATTPPTLDYGAFDDTDNYPIYVPSESVETYKADWSDYASRIQAIQ